MTHHTSPPDAQAASGQQGTAPGPGSGSGSGPGPGPGSGSGASPLAARTRALGAHGEALAAEHLGSRGFVLLERNWRCRSGELDLVMRDGDTLVAVEVKTRSGRGYGSPFEAITREKHARLRRLLVLWLQAHDIRPEALRVDAVAITLLGTAPPQIEHLRGIS